MVKGGGLPLVCRFDPGTNLTDECERTLDLPRRRSRQDSSPLVVNGVVVGPFEEEAEGTGVTSDVVQVQREDPATPCPLISGMTPEPRFPQYRVNKTKQHTHPGVAPRMLRGVTPTSSCC